MFDGVLNTPLRLFNLKWLNTKNAGLCTSPMWILQKISLDRNILRNQKQPFLCNLQNSFSKKFCKIYWKTSAPESLFNIKHPAIWKRRLWHRYFPVNFREHKFFKNKFLMEHILGIAFQRIKLLEMTNRGSYRISCSEVFC